MHSKFKNLIRNSPTLKNLIGNTKDMNADTGQPDYIIIGAGSAGAALAYRLSENPETSVLLIEAGKPAHPYSRMPVSFGLFIDKPGVNWRYSSQP